MQQSVDAGHLIYQAQGAAGPGHGGQGEILTCNKLSVLEDHNTTNCKMTLKQKILKLKLVEV